MIMATNLCYDGARSSFAIYFKFESTTTEEIREENYSEKTSSGNASQNSASGKKDHVIVTEGETSVFKQEVETAVESIRGEQGTASGVQKKFKSDAQSDAQATAATLSMASPPVPISKPVQVSTNWDLDTEPEE